MKKACISFFVSVFLLMAVTGCSILRTDIPASKKSNGIKNAGTALLNTDSKTVRAEGKSEYGILSIVPVGAEIIEQLDAPSVYGKAGDYSIKGDYKVVFKDRRGGETVIAKMDALHIIQPQNAVMNIQKLNMDDADIFYFTPQYRGSNGIPVKFFGITKDGDAFEFKVENNKAQEAGDAGALSEWAVELSTNSGSYAPPAIENENILMRTIYSAGGGQDYEIYNVTFYADIDSRTLKYIEKEVYDNGEKAVFQYIEAVDRQDWETCLQFLPRDEAEGMRNFLADPENKANSAGILSVKSAKIKEIMALPEDEAMKLAGFEEYRARYDVVNAFLTGVDYSVDIESKYIYNGVNYSLMLVGKEDGKWKLLEDSSAPLHMLKQDGYSFGSRDEAAALEIIDARLRGVEINKDGKVLGCNGAKEIFAPGAALDGDKNAEQASDALLRVFLEHFRSGDCPENERIKSYRPGKTAITQKEADGYFVFSAEFSVQAASGSGGWFIGNGRLAEGGWTYYKLYFFTHNEGNGRYKVASWTAYW